MAIEVRTIEDAELPAYFEALTTGFLERPEMGRLVEFARSEWDLARTWAAVDRGRPVGTLRTWPTELTVPGRRRLPAAAVAGVSVLPTHRRRGLLRELIRVEHAAARARGEVAAVLWSSEYPIYGRFGYGPATRTATWTLDASATGFHGHPVDGVEMVTASPGTRDAIRDVFEAWRARTPGEIRRRRHTWDTDLGLKPPPWEPPWRGFVALRRGHDGAVDGYVRYRVEDHWERRQPRSRLEVDELGALTDEAYLALWRFVAETDLVATVRAELRSPSERLPWLLTNARAAQVSDVGDAVWLRLLDVPAALEARTYEGEGRLVIEVVDPEADGGRLRVELEAGPDGARCRPTGTGADLTLDAGALAAAYLGGTRLVDAVVARGAEEERPGALAEADRLFRTDAEPSCSTFF